MAITQADLDNIDQAIASGERSVMMDGHQVTYRSVDELLRARAALANRLAAETDAPRKTRRYRLVSAGRGY